MDDTPERTTLNRANEPTVTDGRPQVSIAVDDEKTAMEVRPPAADKDPIRLLLAFHKRIRLAFKTLARLSRQPRNAIDPVEVGALYEFFAVELAAHDLDEEASLLSRLRRAEHPARLEKLLAACTKQHERLETAVEAALPHLQAVSEKRIQPDPDRLAAVRDDLARILEPHLTLEEQEIFPLARLLITGADEEEMFDEMVARRRRRESHKPSALAIG
jgi:hemerythrin-like domain-containing protein